MHRPKSCCHVNVSKLFVTCMFLNLIVLISRPLGLTVIWGWLPSATLGHKQNQTRHVSREVDCRFSEVYLCWDMTQPLGHASLKVMLVSYGRVILVNYSIHALPLRWRGETCSKLCYSLRLMVVVLYYHSRINVDQSNRERWREFMTCMITYSP